MVLRNEGPSASAAAAGSEPTAQNGPATVLPAWDAVASAQKHNALPCWFVTQPDHAHVSGIIAANFDRRRFPELTGEAIEAIRLHDEGWQTFDGSSPNPHPVTFSNDGRALSFIALPPDHFLRAWDGSITTAERVSALAGVVVSRHFQALGKFGLTKIPDEPQQEKIRTFLAGEQRREARLMNGCELEPAKLERLIAILQFCDLLSLYLCSNAAGDVEFPMDFGMGKIVLRRNGAQVTLTPTPFAAPLTVSFPTFLAGSDHAIAAKRMVDVSLA